MLKVVEAFSGIGSQAKALNNIGLEHEIVATVEWDINAIYAYDLIHNGAQNLDKYADYSKEQVIECLKKYTLSFDGKKPLKKSRLGYISMDVLKKILCAIERTKDLVSIVDVKAEDLPEQVDLLTYSFPCQDLSIGGSWHGNMTGIDRDARNRSGMLWEIERILKEYCEIEKELPTFLLMENVSNILSERHRENFKEWQDYLESIGYINKTYTLDASNFGIPQKRKRTYMVSVKVKESQIDEVKNYFEENNLEKIRCNQAMELKPLEEFLRIDYTKGSYRKEADISNPNFTPSREKILKQNSTIFDGKNVVSDMIKTITTKQDRNPNSGVLYYQSNNIQKAPYRNLTPRECFLLMGFEEKDFQILMDNDFKFRGKQDFFARDKLIRLAGNSIVVNVLEEIFKQLMDIKKYILDKSDGI